MVSLVREGLSVLLLLVFVGSFGSVLPVAFAQDDGGSVGTPCFDFPIEVGEGETVVVEYEIKVGSVESVKLIDLQVDTYKYQCEEYHSDGKYATGPNPSEY